MKELSDWLEKSILSCDAPAAQAWDPRDWADAVPTSMRFGSHLEARMAEVGEREVTLSA
jgi:hypothetical protein